MRIGAVTAVESSNNAKVGRVSATYAPLTTCPTSCPLKTVSDKQGGCYAESGHVGILTRRLGEAAKPFDLTTLAEQEAEAIDRLSGYTPLRLHVSGDCTTDTSAAIVSASADRYSERHGQPVWTYTHAWQDVDRKSWGDVSVLASVHTTEDAHHALSRGYTPAIVYKGDEPEKKAWVQDGLKIIPCPQQSHEGVTCESCRLCWTPRPQAIGFHAHGPSAKRVEGIEVRPRSGPEANEVQK